MSEASLNFDEEVDLLVIGAGAGGMADTDALFETLERRPGVTYTALVLNMAGLERALSVAVPHLSISVSASESHSRANVGKSVDEALAHIAPVIERALAAGISVRAGIQSALGCGFEGRVAPERVVAIAGIFSGLRVHEINLADTAGLGNPRQVFELVGAVRAAVRPDVGLSLHLHDTRGLGIANMVAGLQAGVRIFDAALGGLGGCPFTLVRRIDIENVPMSARRRRVVDHGDVDHRWPARGDGRFERRLQFVGRAQPHTLDAVGPRDRRVVRRLLTLRLRKGRAVG